MTQLRRVFRYAEVLARLQAAQAELRTCETLDAASSECVRCHEKAANSVNEPCGHRMLCMDCARSHRSGPKGATCPQCEAPSDVSEAKPAPVNSFSVRSNAATSVRGSQLHLFSFLVCLFK